MSTVSLATFTRQILAHLSMRVHCEDNDDPRLGNGSNLDGLTGCHRYVLDHVAVLTGLLKQSARLCVLLGSELRTIVSRAAAWASADTGETQMGLKKLRCRCRSSALTIIE